jgi:DNA-binding LacI/PurR family transcriptional regulator
MKSKKASISIMEVARLAGVSKSTVSRVVSDRGGSVSPEAEARVQAAIAELGYIRNQIAAGLRTQRTWMVLIMVPDIANSFWAEIARAAQDGLEAAGYSVVIGNTDWSEVRQERYFGLARSGRFDGLILNSATDDLEAIKAMEVPTVLVGERTETQDIDTVGTDTKAATRLALDHLWATGHRRIAIATNERGSERFLSFRRRTYMNFLAEKGLRFDPAIVFQPRLSEEGGRELAREVLALPGWQDRIDAIFCGNDVLAIATVEALEEAGVRVGRDLSVIGMDDIPAAALVRPALTTVRKLRGQTGRAAAELLLARIADPDRPPEKRLFPGELVTRDSVAERPGRK